MADLLAELETADRAFNKALAKCQRHGSSILREARWVLRLNQREMAQLLGVNNTYLSKLEKGRVPVGAQTLLKVHKALNGKRGKA